MKCVVLPGLPDGPCKRCQYPFCTRTLITPNALHYQAKLGTTAVCLKKAIVARDRPSKQMHTSRKRNQVLTLLFRRKHEQLTKSIRKMERTLDTVLRSISNPTLTSLAGGMVSQSPSPGADGGESSNHDAAGTPDQTRHQDFQNALAASDAIAHMPMPHTATYGAAVAPAPGSPRLHSLPDNVLNPLGLLAEASSSLRRGKQHGLGQSPSAGGAGGSEVGGKNPMSLASLDNPKVGVANLGVYFKPGPMTILPLRQLIIERQVQVGNLGE